MKSTPKISLFVGVITTVLMSLAGFILYPLWSALFIQISALRVLKVFPLGQGFSRRIDRGGSKR